MEQMALPARGSGNVASVKSVYDENRDSRGAEELLKNEGAVI
jgi:hypothetical protein